MNPEPLDQMRHQRDLLADAMGRMFIAFGGVDPDAALSGPQLLLLADDAIACIPALLAIARDAAAFFDALNAPDNPDETTDYVNDPALLAEAARSRELASELAEAEKVIRSLGMSSYGSAQQSRKAADRIAALLPREGV